jgi:hypothetical protein
MFDRTLWTRLPPYKQPLYAGDFEDAGYPYIDVSVDVAVSWNDEWHKVVYWCQKVIGEGRYTWTGSRFWFLDSDDAMRFALAWS